MAKNTNTDETYASAEPIVEVESAPMVLDKTSIREALQLIRSFGTAEFPGTLIEAWENGEEDYLLDVAKVIGFVQKAMSELKSYHDELFDRRAGFASDKITKVVRLRQKSDKVGRPKGNKVDNFLADF